MHAPFGAASGSNPWFRWSYVVDNRHVLLAATRQHITITLVVVAAGLVLSVPLAVLATRSRRIEALVLGTTGVIYTIPSLALFGLLFPLPGFGLRQRTVVVGLTAYSLVILVRNIVAGLHGVPDDVREAARGMGYGPLRELATVTMPLALPAIVAGLRVATVSTVALVTVGALLGYGGLGSLIYEGLNTFYRAQILTASLLCILIGVAADLGFVLLQRQLTPWLRRPR
ncbi:MAG: ABC transporter permease [Frankia sp.]|nr:ABC transporter permease [Frankia sp.]